MGFLDNSGDIILDAVLTDAGRARLAQGDGSFKVVKYAFGDDEVDYSKYRNANHVDGQHPSGSAYYDINILRAPVLEAFTNNTSNMKSKLVSIPRTNLLFLPIMRLDNGLDQGKKLNGTSTQASGSYVITVDQATDDDFFGSDMEAENRVGVFRGFVPKANVGITVHQGLDTTTISKNQTLDSTLRETQFIVEMDNRLGSLANDTGAAISYNFLDDDNIATYNITTGGQNGFISNVTADDTSPIRGPRGNRFRFQVLPSLELRTSKYLFERLGTTGTEWSPGSFGGSVTFSIIDTIVRVTGATTGYRIDIPVRFIKHD
jgi:hypothetical protein